MLLSRHFTKSLFSSLPRESHKRDYEAVTVELNLLSMVHINITNMIYLNTFLKPDIKNKSYLNFRLTISKLLVKAFSVTENKNVGQSQKSVTIKHITIN